MTLKSKVFIFDTNVILHDSSCLYNFQEHDIIIPITVLEELDNFKKGRWLYGSIVCYCIKQYCDRIFM